MKKKLLIGLFALLLACGIAGTFWGPDIAQASSSLWDSCPKGKFNDYYPGDCRLYVDTNSDGICDLSQINPAAAVIIPAVTTNPATAASTPAISETAVVSGTDTTAGTATASGANQVDSYYFLPIALACIALYSTTWVLSSAQKMSKLVHRRIWNAALLATMLGSVLLGLERILVKDYNVSISLPFNVLFWHVEISIILGVIGLIHIIWHWRYFARMLGVNTKQEP
jgi:hypothetical protein